MKALKTDSLEILIGGRSKSTTGCISGAIGTIGGVVGIAALIASPPGWGLAALMGVAFITGFSTGASMGSMYTSC